MVNNCSYSTINYNEIIILFIYLLNHLYAIDVALVPRYQQ